MNTHEILTLAMQQGQTKFKTETRNEFHARVLALKAKQDKRPNPWRKDQSG